MDIVSRLKNFISHLNIPVTQFADTCNIPRPTLSQLLNGRNKKVSDELISKIHDAYPNLSVLWLMFGEGDMLHNKNIEISEPQNESIFDFDNTKQPEEEPTTPGIDFRNDFTNFGSENSKVPSEASNQQTRLSFESDEPATPQTTSMQFHDQNKNTISFESDDKKRIVNIIIYYSDNSFESFIPTPKR